MPAKLRNKVAFITGSSRGIGKETALAFANEGCKLVITDFKDTRKAEAVKKACLDAGAADAFIVKLDVRESKSIHKSVRAAVRKYKKIDILINNAGVLAWKPFDEQSDKDVQNQVRTNLEGLIILTRAALPHVKNAVINISSGAGKEAYAELVPYCATKFGVRGFTQGLAMEYPKLKIYCVNPGMTATEMTDYEGVPPENVAQIILDTVKGKHGRGDGNDVDVYDRL